MLRGKIALKLNKKAKQNGIYSVFNLIYSNKVNSRIRVVINASYKAYLLSMINLTYIKLFGLESYFTHSDNPIYWLNSVRCHKYYKLLRSCVKIGINPVIYFSQLYSIYDYEASKYHHVYNSSFDDLGSYKQIKHVMRNYLNKHSDRYYFQGNPLLDLLYNLFNYLLLPYDDLTCCKYMLRDIKHNIHIYREHLLFILNMPSDRFYHQYHVRKDIITNKYSPHYHRTLFYYFGVPTFYEEPVTFIPVNISTLNAEQYYGFIRFNSFKANRVRLQVYPYQIYNIHCAKQISNFIFRK